MKRTDAISATRAQRRNTYSQLLARAAFAGALGASLLAGSSLLAQATRPAAAPTAPRTAPVGPRTATVPQTPGNTARPAAAPVVNVPTAKPQTESMKTMSVVNGEAISSQELATECLRRYGNEVLESMINKAVISQACAEAGVTITDRDVNDEIDRIAKKFGLSRDRWLVMLEQERGIAEEQYRNEIIWPTLALRHLAADKVEPSPEEMQRAFESEFGPKIKARIIMVGKGEKARELHAQAVANPASFGEIAKNNSEDTNSASAHGLIPPISKHVGDPEIERVAFSLKEGQISPVIAYADKYLIIKCEKHLPETLVPSQHLKDAQQRLHDKLHDEKLRQVSANLFKDLQAKSQVVNVYNDSKLSKQNPGVAAGINGKPITISQLATECMRRHGTEVLDGEINRKILTQALTKQKKAVTQADLDDEIVRAAIKYGFTKPDGSADLERWQKSIEENDGATVDLYIRDAVWPSVALKKLVGDSVKVTEDDLKKGFDANYGERVEVMALGVANNRVAQTVWEQARSLNIEEGFGQLAAQYSIDPVSRGNDGRVPPIRMHGGQPVIEKEAFKLKAGELSSIVAIEDKFIIMRCIGRTRPVVQKYEDVKEELFADIHEKKLRVAMASEFERLKETAQVDNFLAGTSHDGHSPKAPTAGAKTDTNVVPASGTRPTIATPRAGSSGTGAAAPIRK